MTSQMVVCLDATKIVNFSDFDALITDPPYSAHVHASAVSAGPVKGVRSRDFGFEHLSPSLRSWTARAAAGVKRWSVIYSDVEGAGWWRIALDAAGAEYVRTVPWIRWSMPQLSGDRPPTGQEKLVLAHASEPDTDLILSHHQRIGKRGGRKSLAKHWNGPGNLTHLAHKCLRGEGKHKAEKPLDQALDLVSWFTEPGEYVFDPFAGSGTIGLACFLLGRNYMGCEINSEWAERAHVRARGQMLPRDVERWERWEKSKAA